MNSSRLNWLDSLSWQAEFYQRANRRHRTEPDFSGVWGDDADTSPIRIFRALAKETLHILGLHTTGEKIIIEWLRTNAEPLWESRSLLSDEVSRLLYDDVILLRLTGHQQFYFPRIDFEDIIEIIAEKPFQNSDLPKDYCGLPLKLFDIRLTERPDVPQLKIIACKEALVSLNSSRQYLIRRKSVDISPVAGDIVLDCGACIGDMSLLFAGLVGAKGAVHSFDPIPLHARYGRLQASLNPALAHVMHINELAVSDRTFLTKGDKSDTDKIVPGGLAVNYFASTSLDDYASGRLNRVDFIKMDIEKAEMSALSGAERIIKEFKPRLAISVYHKPEDLWQIPLKLKALNPAYELHFGHHSPILWESVVYAVNRQDR